MRTKKRKPGPLMSLALCWGEQWSQLGLRRQVVALGIFTSLAAALALALEIPTKSVPLQAGETATEDIRAPRSGYYVDIRATVENQREAELTVPPVYDVAPHVFDTAQSRIHNTFENLRAARETPAVSTAEKLAGLKAERNLKLVGDQNLREALSASNENLAGVEKSIKDAVGGVFHQGIRSNTQDLEIAHSMLRTLLQGSEVPNALRGFAAQVAIAAVQEPNFIYNTEDTERRRKEKRDEVEPIRRRIEAGEVIVKAGHELTQSEVDKLVALGLQGPRLDPKRAAALFLLTLFFVSVTGLYMRQYSLKIFNADRNMLLLSMLVLLGLISFKIAAQFPGVDYAAVPITTTIGMVVCIMLDARFAVMVAMMVGVLAATLSSNQFAVLVMSLGSALVGIRSVAELHSRAQLTRTAFLLGGANVILSASVGTLTNDTTSDILIEMSWGLGSGIACTILTLGLVMFLERPFGITSHLRLLELSDPNEPILKRLQIESPGTCTHSIMVGNLAESAAKAINADALLTRVASLYHDIGKIKRPSCFAENQFSADNIHDKLTPTLSALAIIAHVKEGIEMARECKLPQAIIDIIPQHHGTNLVSYFYSRALESLSEGEVNDAAFRYPGPKPQTREAGIIMLADGVEATARSLANPTPARVEAMVRKIFRERLDEGQLTECDLTLKDLDTIEKTFAHMLKGLLHTRVEYPGQDRDLPAIPFDPSKKRRKGDASDDRVSVVPRSEKGAGKETTGPSHHLRRISGRGS